jgi:hypothetical protein
MQTEPDIAALAHVIQLAIAPVFLLTGVGSLLAVMANRLGRIIDRARFVENSWNVFSEKQRDDARLEFSGLAHRAGLTSKAINFCALAALLVCVLIAALFVDAFIGLSLKWLVGGLFVLAMCSLSGGIVCFLLEVHIAMRTLSIGPPVSDLNSNIGEQEKSDLVRKRTDDAGHAL